MFKTITLLKRRADLDCAEFMRRYETSHARLGERVMQGFACRYVRRYLTAVPNPVTGEAGEPEYDVITEAWFKDRQTWEAFANALSEEKLSNEVAADEDTLFDRSRNRFFLVEEHESQLS